MFYELITLSLGLAALVTAEVRHVQVGSKGLNFDPDSTRAAEGDIVEFHFDAMHSVVAGDYNAACKPVKVEGFYSEEMPDGDNSYFSIVINNTHPIFFYCGIPGHCQAGMVGVINENSEKSLAAYKGAAMGSDGTDTPEGVFGGNQSSQAITDSSSSSSSSESSSSSSSTSSGAGAESSMSTTTAPTTSAETSSSSSPSATTTTASGSDAGHLTSPMEAIACLILAGIAAVFVL